MKAPQFYIALALGTLCLILSITTIVLGKNNNNLQRLVQAQQEEINRGNMSLQIRQNLLNDMAQMSLKNEKIKQILSNNGWTVSANPPGAPASTPASTPTTTTPAQ
ncbi:MAG: hypothetical protein PHQ12_13250 [Chthoniobacteraceae bacterium]|nr:hypothetical protein [Chthoniobacteraceae bacterium]